MFGTFVGTFIKKTFYWNPTFSQSKDGVGYEEIK
jgi:hypothetical protein